MSCDRLELQVELGSIIILRLWSKKNQRNNVEQKKQKAENGFDWVAGNEAWVAHYKLFSLG